MKNSKEELINKINGLDENSREIKQLNEYFDLISEDHKDMGYANTIKNIPILIKNLAMLNPLAKGILDSKEYYELRDHITNTRNSLRVISENIKNGKSMVVIPTINEVTKKTAIALLETDKLLTSVNHKVNIAISKGKTEAAHALIDSSQEYVKLLKEASSLLSDNLEVKKAKEQKSKKAKDSKETPKNKESVEVKELTELKSKPESKEVDNSSKADEKKETPAKARARKAREAKAEKQQAPKEEAKTEEAKTEEAKTEEAK